MLSMFSSSTAQEPTMNYNDFEQMLVAARLV